MQLYLEPTYHTFDKPTYLHRMHGRGVWGPPMILFPEPCASLPILWTFLIEDFLSESGKWVSEYFVRVVTRCWKVVPSFHRHGCLKLALHISCDVVGPTSHQTGRPTWSTEVTVQSTLMSSVKFHGRMMHGSFQQVVASHATAVEKIWNG